MGVLRLSSFVTVAFVASVVWKAFEVLGITKFTGRSFLSLLLITNVGAILLFSFYRTWVYPLLLDPTRHLPGPQGGWPFVGYAFEQFKRPPTLKFLEWMNTIPNNGLLRYKCFFGSYRIIPCSSQILSEFLVTKSYDFQKPAERREILRIVLGNGLINVEGDVHRFQRKNINPSFSFRQIKSLYPLMIAKSLEMTKRLQLELVSKAPATLAAELELNQWASRATLDIIGVAALGHEFNTLHNDDDELARLYEWMFQPDFRRRFWFGLSLILPPWLLTNLPIRLSREITSVKATLRRIGMKLVEDKKHSVKNESTISVDTLAHIIKSDNFSDEELLDQVLTFLAAGHETTSSAFTWTLFELARRPELQSRLRNEVRQAIDLHNTSSAISSDQLASALENLPLLNGTCNETLRLWPTVPATLREAAIDTSLGGTFIPKSTEILLPIWSINRSPHLWGSNSLEYCPERWIDSDTGKANNHGGVSSNYGFQTFLHGPRSCIGQGFARAELRALVATFVTSFEFSLAQPAEQITAYGLITVKPKYGLTLNMRPV